MMDAKKRNHYAYLEGWISIVTNIVLFAFKLVVGLMTHSLAIMADAWHTLSDSVSSLIVILGVKYSSKPPDKEHPFGHGRAEIIATNIIGVLLSIIAAKFFWEGIKRIIVREETIYTMSAIVVTVLSIIVKEALAQYALWAYKKSDSPTLKADAWHHRSDALSSVVILIGIFLGKYFWWMDGVLSIIVSCMIFYATFGILKESFHTLMGESITDDLEGRIREICIAKEGSDLNMHHIHVHNYGHHKEITFHIKLPGAITLREAHTRATGIEIALMDKLGVESTIHVEVEGEHL